MVLALLVLHACRRYAGFGFTHARTCVCLHAYMQTRMRVQAYIYYLDWNHYVCVGAYYTCVCMYVCFHIDTAYECRSMNAFVYSYM